MIRDSGETVIVTLFLWPQNRTILTIAAIAKAFTCVAYALELKCYAFPQNFRLDIFLVRQRFQPWHLW